MLSPTEFKDPNRAMDCDHHINPKDRWNFNKKGFMIARREKGNEVVIARIWVKCYLQIPEGNRKSEIGTSNLNLVYFGHRCSNF
jgi:hypothetical protein